jgi:hypothetical protein
MTAHIQLPIGFAKTFDAVSLHAAQDVAVRKHLEEYGVIDRDFAEQGGLPCGKVRNLGQRIRNLRLQGMKIETDTATDPANCHYRLVDRPSLQDIYDQ